MGKLPEDWKLVKLGEVGEVITGTTPSTKIREYYGGPFKLISPANLDNGKYVTTWHKSLSEKGFAQSRPLPKDTILVGCIGNVGKLGMTADDMSATNQQINALICKDGYNSHYIYYNLLFNKEALQKAAVKTTVPILNKTNFELFEIWIPPLPEQRKIAGVLSLVQRAIEQQEKLIQVTTELKKALMKKLFTEGLQCEPQKMTEIGPIPKSWEVMKFGDIAEFKNGINFSKQQKGEKGILTIDVLNMYGHNYYLFSSNLYKVNIKITNDYLLKDGDILFVRSSLKQEGIGWACMFKEEYFQGEPITFCGFIIRARITKKDIINSAFLTNYFRTEQARRILQSGGARVAITNLNQGMLKNVPIPMPSIKEQEKIVKYIDIIDSKIEYHKNYRDLLQSLFRTLLHQLMTAQIRMGDIDLDFLDKKEIQYECN